MAVFRRLSVYGAGLVWVYRSPWVWVEGRRGEGGGGLRFGGWEGSRGDPHPHPLPRRGRGGCGAAGMGGPGGIERLTPTLPVARSPSWATAPRGMAVFRRLSVYGAGLVWVYRSPWVWGEVRRGEGGGGLRFGGWEGYRGDPHPNPLPRRERGPEG